MNIVVVAQNKGGDGKTTISRLLAEYFARKNLRVLAIDLDPQCNLSQRLVAMDMDESDPDGVLPPVHPDFDPEDIDPNYPNWNGRSSIVDIFQAGPVYPYSTSVPNLDLLPGYGAGLRAVELVTKEEVKQRVHDRLAEFLELSEVRDSYELVIIDTSPSKGPLNQGAVRAATHMLIPCQMEQQSVEGLRGMLQMVRHENRNRAVNNPLQLIGILPNKFRANVSLQEGIKEALERDVVINSYLLPVLLSLRVVFSETDHPDAKPRSVFDLPASNKAREEAEAVCRHVELTLYGQALGILPPPAMAAAVEEVAHEQ